jgi:chromosome segregation ATPase
MKKISDDKKLKILYYYDVGIPPPVIAIALKISETTVKTILKENNRSGPQPKFTQAYNTWFYLNQQIGEPTINFPSKDHQQREQRLTEEKNELKEKNTQITNELQKANDREQNQKQEFKKITNELGQKNLKIEELEQRIIELTKAEETEKLKKEKLQDKNNDLYELLIKKVREFGEEKTKVIKLELENKTMQKEHHETLEKLGEGVTAMSTKLKQSEEMNNTLIQKITQYQKKVLRLEDNVRNLKIGTICGVVGGVVVGIGGVLIYQKLSSSPFNDSSNNTIKEVIPS